MRIAFFVSEFPVVSETFVLNPIVGMLQRGHDVIIYTRECNETIALTHEEIEKYDLLARTRFDAPIPKPGLARVQSAIARLALWGWRHPMTTLNSLNLFRYGWSALTLQLVHERLPANRCVHEYDVIHCHFGRNGRRAIELRNLGVLVGPIITTLHSYDINALSQAGGPKLYDKLFQEGEMFSVGSEFLRKRVVAFGAPDERVIYMPIGVDLPRFPFFERGKRSTKEFRLLTVARLVNVNGIEYALRAVALLAGKSQKIRYQIVGDGPLRDSLERLSRQLNLSAFVEFVGSVPHGRVRALLEEAHVLVLPSIVTEWGEVENQPVVLAEAQASGLPIIATAIGGIPESIREDKSGFLVPPKDPAALAAAIRQLANNPALWGAMGRAGRAYVEEHFNLETLNETWVNIYRTLAGSSRT